MKVENKHIVVQSDVNGLVIADYIDNAQIWTGNKITSGDTDLFVSDLKSLEVDTVIESIADCPQCPELIHLESEPRTPASDEAVLKLIEKGSVIITVQ